MDGEAGTLTHHMDATTRKVLVVIAALLGAAFLVLGILTLVRGENPLLGVVDVLLGVIWLTGAALLYRRGRRV